MTCGLATGVPIMGKRKQLNKNECKQTLLYIVNEQTTTRFRQKQCHQRAFVQVVIVLVRETVINEMTIEEAVHSRAK